MQVGGFQRYSGRSSESVPRTPNAEACSVVVKYFERLRVTLLLFVTSQRIAGILGTSRSECRTFLCLFDRVAFWVFFPKPAEHGTRRARKI